jgi:hypothetical protein
MICRSIVVLAAFALATASAAGAAEPIKPLRTLVYSVQFSAQSRTAEQTSGFPGGEGQQSAGVGHGLVERGSTVSDDGTLTVDVIAPTADAGLVVDAVWAGKETGHRAIRVAIYSDGRLSYDPSKRPAPQALRLLPMLARGLIAGRDVAAGSAWTIEPAAPAKGTITYRVSDLTGEIATLAIEANYKVSGPHGYDEQDHATARYATDRLCPVGYDLTARSRRQPSPEQYVTETSHLTATLVSDTFAKK